MTMNTVLNKKQTVLKLFGCAIFFLMFGVGCAPSNGSMKLPEKISFTTSDHVIIVGDYYQSAVSSNRCILMLHMMPETRASWRPLAEELVKADVNVLAIDERGHGESVKTTDGKILDYAKFSNAEQQAKIIDVQAAVAWLNQKGIETKDISLVGGSIGANLALNFAADHPEIAKTVALAPSLDYNGVTTSEAV